MSDFIKKKENKEEKAGPSGRGIAPKKKIKKPEMILTIGDKEYRMSDVENMAKGGRAGFKAGSKGCKLAKKGRGRAYGKNS